MKSDIKKILITGGAGYIGNTLIKALPKDVEIVVIDNFHIDTDYKRLINLKLQKKRKLTVIKANVAEVEKYNYMISDIDAVIYMASLNSSSESDNHPHKYLTENNVNLQIFLDSLSKSSLNLKKFILTSTRGVYGEGSFICSNCERFSFPKYSEILKCSFCNSQNITAQKIKESDSVYPTSYYGLTKRIQEDLITMYCIKRNIKFDIFRIFNVFGTDQEKYYSHIGIIPRMHSQIKSKSEIYLNGNGKMTRDFIDVNDVVSVIKSSILNKNLRKDLVEIYNLGTGRPVSLNDIAAFFKDLGYIFKINYIKEFSDIKYSSADNTKLIKIFNIKKFSNIFDYLKKTYSIT